MDGTQRRILEAAIACIERYGLNNLTVRRIAAEAGVNVAAINYHFHTKEQLIERVLALTIHNAFDWDDLGHTEGLPPREQLYAILEHLMQGAQHYPTTTRAHFYEAMVNGNYDTPAVRAINRFLEGVYERFRKKGCELPERELRFAIAQVFMAGLFVPGVAPGLFQPFMGACLTDEENRGLYLRLLIDGLLGGC